LQPQGNTYMIANGGILVQWTGKYETWIMDWTIDWTMDCFHTRR